jgi:hypothetical protein
MLKRLFSKFGSRSVPKNQLFEIPVKVARGSNRAMPEHLKGAVVCCYAASTDHETALIRTVTKLKEEGFVFEDVVGGKISQLDPRKWSQHVEAKWKEWAHYMPSEKEVLAGVNAGRIFYGPFLSYES